MPGRSATIGAGGGSVAKEGPQGCRYNRVEGAHWPQTIICDCAGYARRQSAPAPYSSPGRSPNLSPRLNRRELLVAGSTVGAVYGGHVGRGPPGGGGGRAGPVCTTLGRPRQDDRRPGSGGSALVPGRALRVRHSGCPEQRALGRAQGPVGSLYAGRTRGFGQRDGRRLGPRRRARSVCFRWFPARV